MSVPIKIGIIVPFLLAVSVSAISQTTSFENARVKGRDYSGKSFDGSSFKDAVLDGVQFRGSSLRGATFKDADLCHVSFSGADLTGAIFDGATFTCPNDFAEATLTRASFKGTALNQSHFDSADMREANFQDASGFWSLVQADMRGADLRGANFSSLDNTGIAGCDRIPGLKMDRAKYDAKTKWMRSCDMPIERAIKVE